MINFLLKIFRKPLNCRLNGPAPRVAERTEQFALDVVAKIQKQLNIAFTAATGLNALEDLYQPIRSFATGRTPTARLVLVELSQVLRRFEHIDSFVHHDETARADHRTRCDQAFVMHADIFADDLIGADDVN